MTVKNRVIKKHEKWGIGGAIVGSIALLITATSIDGRAPWELHAKKINAVGMAPATAIVPKKGVITYSTTINPQALAAIQSKIWVAVGTINAPSTLKLPATSIYGKTPWTVPSKCHQKSGQFVVHNVLATGKNLRKYIALALKKNIVCTK